jgi:hypothetical protein
VKAFGKFDLFCQAEASGGSMSWLSQLAESPLIGASMNRVLQPMARRILTELHTAGFEDMRPAHLTVLRHLWPQGQRISTLADRTGITKASVVYLVDQRR